MSTPNLDSWYRLDRPKAALVAQKVPVGIGSRKFGATADALAVGPSPCWLVGVTFKVNVDPGVPVTARVRLVTVPVAAPDSLYPVARAAAVHEKSTLPCTLVLAVAVTTVEPGRRSEDV